MADELFQIKGDAPAVPDLKFWSLLGHESLSRASHYELTVLSQNKSVAAKDVLGYAFDVVVKFQDRSQGWHERHCQGHAVRFLRVRQVGRYFEYRITLRSWFWLLTKRRNSRILQDKPVLDVLDAVFEDSPIRRFKKTRFDHVIDPHNPHRYCVQFEESDYHFLSRLLEEEGIYYWFDAHDAPGTMILADASSVAHDKLPVESTLAYQTLDRGEARFNEISSWIAGKRFETGKWAASDRNFKTVRKDLGVTLDASDQYELPDLEEFEFPGDYFNTDDGDLATRRRSDELTGRRERHWAMTGWPDVAVGKSFKYQGDPDSSRNGEYIIASCTFVICHPGYEGLGDALATSNGSAIFDAMLRDDAVNVGADEVLRDLVAGALEPKLSARGARAFVLGLMPQAVPYKPPRLTPRVRMPGPQSAIVVGPAGEEMHVDEFGRVKVHFHWDRYDDSNEKSTCWVRVSQPWAGKSWGGYFAPRIGQEVIVDFLNGDPDRPLIMGRVYNDDQPIPYDSPTQSGFKTRSTPKGGPSNFNEFRFEDKKGEEQVFLHAEKNYDIEVEHDETHHVEHDRTKKVDNDETTTIGHDRTETVINNEDITIGVNRTEMVGAQEKITIGASRTETVGASENVTVAASRVHTVGASDTLTVGAARTENIGAALTQSVGAAYTQTVGGPISMTCGGPMTLTAAGGLTVFAPGGVKYVDSYFSKLGGNLLENYNTIVKFTPVSIEGTGFKSEVCGVKIDKGGLYNKKVATAMLQLGLKMENSGPVLKKAAVVIDKAALHLLG